MVKLRIEIQINLILKKKKNKSVNDLNFTPTFFDKEMNINFVSHLNINIYTNRSNNQYSFYNDENNNKNN